MIKELKRLCGDKKLPAVLCELGFPPADKSEKADKKAYKDAMKNFHSDKNQNAEVRDRIWGDEASKILNSMKYW